MSREGRKEVRSLWFFSSSFLFFFFKGEGVLGEGVGVRDIFLGYRLVVCWRFRHGHVR